jgi:hypothetical protein
MIDVDDDASELEEKTRATMEPRTRGKPVDEDAPGGWRALERAVGQCLVEVDVRVVVVVVRVVAGRMMLCGRMPCRLLRLGDGVVRVWTHHDRRWSLPFGHASGRVHFSTAPRRMVEVSGA